jgi:hypothetical protein
VVPADAPLGTPVNVQAALVDLVTGAWRLTNALTLLFSGEPMTTVVQGDHSQHRLGQTPCGGVLVISNVADWSAFWVLHGAFSYPPQRGEREPDGEDLRRAGGLLRFRSAA